MKSTNIFFLYIIIKKESTSNVDICWKDFLREKEKEHIAITLKKKKDSMYFSFFPVSSHSRHREIVQKYVMSLFLQKILS